MFLELRTGSLTEPLTGRVWDQQTIGNELYRRIAHYQSRGMNYSDRVFLHHGNCLEFFVDVLAVWTVGGCVVPIDSRLTKFEVETLARWAGPRFSVIQGGLDASILSGLQNLNVTVLETSEASVPQSAPLITGNLLTLDQPALILFTSGTTGQPKGVVHTHRSLRARWMALRQSLDLRKFRRTLCLLPTHFGHGLICNSLFPWLSGLDLFVLPPFSPEVIVRLGELLDKYEITFMSSVPSIWRMALKMAKPPQTGNLQLVFCGSAPLSAFLWKEIQEWTGMQEVFNVYGITETASWTAGTSVPGWNPEDGLIGEPWGAVVKILRSSTTSRPVELIEECTRGEAGYVWLNTPALMSGYLERDDLTKEVVNQGWFMTGDIGFVDDRGWLYLRGREREEINKGGMKVYPADIDAVVERFEGTLDVCTFGYDGDPLYGENVGIAIRLRDTNKTTFRDLYNWTKQHLARYQIPARWFTVDEIPRTSRGKVNRVKVAQVCASLAPVEIQKLMNEDF